MAYLVQLVKANSRSFKHLPIGPIGAQLSLQDDIWATAAEASIGQCFNDWIVDNPRDHGALTVRPACICTMG